MKRSFFAFTGLLVLAGLCAGCEGSTGGPPERKKLPDLAGSPSWEGPYQQEQEQQEFPSGKLFVYSDTSIDGKTYISLLLHNPAQDSVALALINMYKPMVGSAIGFLQQRGKAGVLLDLRGKAGSREFSASFVTKNRQGLSMPVIFLWDASSGARADLFMERLREIPGVESIAGRNKTVPCF